MRFELLKMTKAKCSHYNTRTEKRGKRDVLAIDLDVNFDLSNNVLRVFDPDLLDSLYLDDGQTVAAGTEKVLKQFRFPKMKLPIGWEVTLPGFTFECDYGLGAEGKSNLWLEGCKVGKFKLTPKEGGTLNIACQVQNATDQLDTDMLGKLNGLILAPYIEMRLIPPTPEEVLAQADKEKKAKSTDNGAPLFDAAPDDKKPQPPQSAGDIFVAANTLKSTAKVTVKKSRKPVKVSRPSRLGTDATQAKRQHKILASHDAAAKTKIKAKPGGKAGTPASAKRAAAGLP